MALSSLEVEAQIGGGEYEQGPWPPAQFGQWTGPWDFKEEMIRETPESPIYLPLVTEITHAAVLPPASPAQPTGGHAGKVIFINDRLPTANPLGWEMNDQPTFVWDWRAPTSVDTLWVGNTTYEDLFCSGHAFLPNGNWFVTGGLDRPTALNTEFPVGHSGTFVLRTDLSTLFWQAQPDGGDKRWYPMAVWTPPGVFIGGHFGFPLSMDERRQVFVPGAPGQGTWNSHVFNHRALVTPGGAFEIDCLDPPRLPLKDYPRLMVLSTGEIIRLDGQSKSDAQGNIFHQSQFLNIDPAFPKDCPADVENPWHWRQGTVTGDTEATRHAGGNAVLLLTQHSEPAFDKWIETVYAIGGTVHGEDDKPCPCEAAGVTNLVRRLQRDTEASNDPAELNYQPWYQQAWETSDANPLAEGAGPKAMRRPRVNCNTVILPNGELLTLGGTRMDDDPLTQAPGCAGTEPPVDPNFQSLPNPSGQGCLHVRRAESYRPNEVFAASLGDPQPAWTLLAPQQHFRQYHSVGFLLPDGSVGSAGGTWFGFNALTEQNEDHRYSVEVYKPWYFFSGMRPVIEVPPPAELLQREEQVYVIEVRTRAGFSVDRMTLVRNGSVTHAFDSDQRYMELHLEEPPALKAGTTDTWIVRFRIPGNPYAAPSGWYLLSAVDNIHRPSESISVQIQ